MRRLLVLLAVAAFPADAAALGPARTLGTGAAEPPAVSAHPDGTTAVAWATARRVRVRVAPRGGRFGPVQELRRPGPFPRDVQVHALRDGGALAVWRVDAPGSPDADGTEYSLLRAAHRRPGAARFGRGFALTGADEYEPEVAVHARDRPLVVSADDGVLTRVVVDGERLRGRLRLRLPPYAGLDGLDAERRPARALVRDGTRLRPLPLVPGGRFERSVVRGALRGSVRTASDALGAHTVLWDDNEDEVLAARPGPGGRLRRQRLDRSASVVHSALATTPAGGALAVWRRSDETRDFRNSLRLVWAPPGERFGRAIRLDGDRVREPPGVALAPGGRGVVSWLTGAPARVRVLRVDGGRPVRRRTYAVAAAEVDAGCSGGECTPVPAAVDARGRATVVWRDRRGGGRVRAVRFGV